MAKIRSNSPDLGKKFGRPDLERVGLFSEMPYISAKARTQKKTTREPANMMCEGRKVKDGTQIGYFDKVYKRIFSKEAIRGRGRKEKPPKVKYISGRPFLPPIGFKQHSCPGDYYGTFSGIIEAFSNKRKPLPKKKPVGRNIYGNPGKLGGPGYPDITINRYPEHAPDRYGLKPKYKVYGKILGRPMIPTHFPQPCFDKNPFREAEGMQPGPTYVRPKIREKRFLPPGHLVPTGPGKWQGGCHDGCFNKFPEHMTDRQKIKPKKKEEGIFYPPPTMLKSYYNTSIVFQTVDLKVHQQSYKTFQPVYNKYLVS